MSSAHIMDILCSHHLHGPHYMARLLKMAIQIGYIYVSTHTHNVSYILALPILYGQ